MSKYRNFIFTFNNYPNTDLVDNIACRYIAYGKEVSPTTGTPHLQGFICYENATTLKSVIKKLKGCHVEVMHGSIDNNEQYCNKDGLFTERGDKPMSNLNKGRANQVRYQHAWDNAKQGKIEDIDADMLVRHYSTLKRIEKDYMVKPEAIDGCCGLWISGDTGSGKSHVVINTYPGRYIKSLNKWWDGYQGEDIVHIDELHPGLAKFGWGANLKLWADKWPFMAEVKGGSMQIRPKKIIVTSNYTIDQMMFEEADLSAIKRRFIEVVKTRDQNIIV